MMTFGEKINQIKGNIKAVNHSGSVAGLFYASSISAKNTFITRDAVAYALPPINFSTDDCYTYYKNASTTKPSLWQE